MSRHRIGKVGKDDGSAVALLWRRFFARSTDFLFWFLLWYFLEEWLFLPPWQHSLFHFLFDQFVACVLMVLTEPLFLAGFATTPGKALFGLAVFADPGVRLTIRQACRRTGLVWRFLLGYGLPFYRLVALARAYAAKRQGSGFEWENETLLCRLKPV